MEEVFKNFADHLALGMELIAVLVITFGTIKAAIGLFKPNSDKRHPFAGKKLVWVGFGVWLLLGLEFELAADIVRTTISPTWTQLGQLATIAVLRTFLNYFLEKDLEKYAEEQSSEEKAPMFQPAIKTEEAKA